MAQAGLELGVDPLFSSFANKPIMPPIDFFGRIGLETPKFQKRIFGASSVKLAAQCCRQMFRQYFTRSLRGRKCARRKAGALRTMLSRFGGSFTMP